MIDYGHRYADDEIKRLEKKIRKLYNQATDEMGQRFMEKFKKIAEQDEKKKKLFDEGKLSPEEFLQWRREITMQQKWYGELMERLGRDMVDADKAAMEMVSDRMGMVFAENANFAAWQISHDANVNLSWTLYDRATVGLLIRDDPQLLPLPAVDVPLDMRWNMGHVRDEITKGLLAGEPIPDIAARLQKVTGMGYNAAVRNARTATTGAQNAGRVYRYRQAEKMGINLQKKWLATLDNRTRHEHRLLDGQTCPTGGKFRVEGMEIEYPGDPKAPGRLVYNCRCTLIADIHGVNGTVQNRYSKLDGMSYQEWKHELKRSKSGENNA